MSDDSESQGRQGGPKQLLRVNQASKNYLFWCSLSPRRTKFIMLGGLKTVMELITKYCFFDDMEINGSSYFQRRMIEVLQQVHTTKDGLLHQFKEMVRHDLHPSW
jgi:hypothetical protein